MAQLLSDMCKTALMSASFFCEDKVSDASFVIEREQFGVGTFIGSTFCDIATIFSLSTDVWADAVIAPVALKSPFDVFRSIAPLTAKGTSIPLTDATRLSGPTFSVSARAPDMAR